MAAGKKVNKKQVKTETIQESFEYLLRWCVGLLATVYGVLILGVLPFYNEEGFTHIGTDKSTFFRSCTVFFSKILIPAFVLWVTAVIVVMYGKKRAGENWKPKLKLSLADGFAVAYGFSVCVSYLCTDYRATALWGTTGWFMGLLPHLTLVSIYFLVSRMAVFSQYLIYLCIPVSAVTFILGYLNRFDVWPLSMENSGLPLYISTVGNINWFCGYIVSTIFVGVGLLWLDNGWRKWYTILLSVYTCLGFGMLVVQGSDSGLFALAAVMLAMFVLSAKSKEMARMKRFWLLVGLFALACLITMCVRLLFPEQMNYTSGTINLLTKSVVPLFIAVLAVTGRWYAGHKTAPKVWPVLARVACVGVAVVIASLVVMIGANTAKPGSLGALSDKAIFTFNDTWGSNRGATWRIGLKCFAEQDGLHKLVGVGPDCMADYLYKGSSEELLTDVKTAFENKRLTNAHNEILTLLVNTGLCGALSFAGFFIVLLKMLLQAFEKKTYAAACGLCLLGYMANNIWSFQQSLSISTIFVIMGLGASFLGEERMASGKSN